MKTTQPISGAIHAFNLSKNEAIHLIFHPNLRLPMREALFIKRNAKKWEQFQKEPSENPDEQSDRFITTLDDLAYSRTYYPQSKVTRWINAIAVSIYQQIYPSKKQPLNRLLTFWSQEVPLVIYKHRRVLWFTLFYFSACVAIGFLSSSTDANFVKGILGEEYVAMTEENISKGDPFGVYRDNDRFGMFIRIAINNIRVSFLAYVLGLVYWLLPFPYATLRLLFYNGVMIGAFEYLFFAKGLGLQSILVIWIHGTMEIWSIVIAGMAGIILGNSLLFPGTFTRLQSLKTGVKESIKIILTLVPFFVAAAFLESYVTYQMSDTFAKGGKGGLPTWASVLILTMSVAFIIFYFFILPHRLGKKQGKQQAFLYELKTIEP